MRRKGFFEFFTSPCGYEECRKRFQLGPNSLRRKQMECVSFFREERGQKCERESGRGTEPCCRRGEKGQFVSSTTGSPRCPRKVGQSLLCGLLCETLARACGRWGNTAGMGVRADEDRGRGCEQPRCAAHTGIAGTRRRLVAILIQACY